MTGTSLEIIKQHLGSFKSVGLKELDRVALLDRMDTKFAFTVEQLPTFLDQLKDKYFVLEINNSRMFQYESLYFDTDSFALFYQHLCGRMNRYKVRFRKYVESDLSFFEIKFKNNKGRTVKSRVRQYGENSIQGDALLLLNEKSTLSSSDLKAIMWVNYIRVTLVSSDFKERLTLDLDLTFKNDTDEKNITQLVIAEVKQSKAGRSEFIRVMKRAHIRTGAISKYCYGVMSLFKSVKINNFKEQLIHLNKLLHASPAGH